MSFPLGSVYRLAPWRALLGLLTLLASSDQVSATHDNSNASFVVIDNGAAIPIKSASDLPKEYSGQTLYLGSAIALKQRPATPKPTPSALKKDAGTRSDIPATAVVSPSITVRKSADGKVAGAHPAASKTSTSGTTSEEDPGDDYAKVTTMPDPIEPVNRGTFWVNHQIYHYVLHPACKAYQTVLPSPVRRGIYNVFDNLEFPIRFVNDLLQFNFKKAGFETERFVINSTAGIGGVMNVSKKVPWLADMPKTDTDSTLAKWGVPAGCYIVWPIIGPKSLRDTVGFVGDLVLDPVTWVTYGAIGGIAGATTLAVTTPDAARNVSEKLDTYETVTHNSINRYQAIRSAYTQNRKKVESN